MSRFLICIILALNAFRLEAANAVPVLTPATTASTTNEQVAVALFTGVAIADSDDQQMTRMTVTIANPLDGDDLSHGTLPSGINVDSDTGTRLVFGGGANTATYEALLQTIKFTAGGDQPGTLRAISAVVRDGNGDSQPVVATVTINAVNDLPICRGNANRTVFEQEAVALYPDSTIEDVDSTNLISLVATIANPLVGDTLTCTAPAGVTAVPGVGTLSATGTASVSAYQALLRSITFRPNSDSPGNSRTITVKVKDSGGGESTGLAVVVNISHVVDIAGFVGDLSYNLDSGRLRLASAATMLAINSADRDLVLINGSRLVATLRGAKADEDILSLSGNSSAGLMLAPGSKIRRIALAPAPAVEVASYQLGTHKVTITFNGSATAADIENASQLFVYDNVFSVGGSLSTRTVDLVFEENGRPVSNTLSRSILMYAPNKPPEIILGVPPNNFTVQPNSSQVIRDVNIRAHDPDIPPTAAVNLFFTVLSSPAYGNLLVLRAGKQEAILVNKEFTQAELALGLVSYQHRGGTIPTDSIGFQVREFGLNGLISKSVTFLITIGVSRGAAIISDPVLVAEKNVKFSHYIRFVGLSGKDTPKVSVTGAIPAAKSTVSIDVDGVSSVWQHTFTEAGDVDVTVSAQVDGQEIIQKMRIRVVSNPSGGG